MANIQIIENSVVAPKGFVSWGLHSGMRKNTEKKDLALIASKVPATAAGCFTKNKVKASPIWVCQRHLQNHKAQAIICNSGNANACNADGEEKAIMMCKLAAKELGLDPQDVLVASTGVIGQPLPIEPVASKIGELAANLAGTKEAAQSAAAAIMTTDLTPKEIAVSFPLGGKECKMGGIAKGSGMIHPNMGTMLCFITTDAAIDAALLQKALLCCVEDTFNMVSVDGDTSTNDTVLVLANELAENEKITAENEDYQTFCQALKTVCEHLAKCIAKDGEGATKMLECKVFSAPDTNCAKVVAKSVICSSLFKAAMFGADANWGRVLCAIGYAPAEFDIQKVEVSLASAKGRVLVCQNGAGVEFSEEAAKEILLEDEIQIWIDLHQGGAAATAWGCDLTYDYVKINGDYRS